MRGEELVNHIKEMEAMLFWFTTKLLMKVAYEYAEANNHQDRFNTARKEAGRDWLKGFMSRHRDDLSLHTPEATSAVRALGYNAVSVGKFFDLLEKLQDTHQFTPDRIYNVDETGISTVPNKLSPQKKTQVGCLSSAKRGQLTTAEICMSAAGYFIPSLFIFPRKCMKPEQRSSMINRSATLVWLDAVRHIRYMV